MPGRAAGSASAGRAHRSKLHPDSWLSCPRVRSDEAGHHPGRKLDLDPVDRDTIAEAFGRPFADDRRRHTGAVRPHARLRARRASFGGGSVKTRSRSAHRRMHLVPTSKRKRECRHEATTPSRPHASLSNTDERTETAVRVLFAAATASTTGSTTCSQRITPGWRRARTDGLTARRRRRSRGRRAPGSGWRVGSCRAAAWRARPRRRFRRS